MAIWSSLLSGDRLRAKAFRSSVLTAVGYFGESAVRLGSNLILTRLLFPEAFGVMALIQVVIVGLNMFSDVGIRQAVIRDPQGEDPAFLNTAFVLQAARGVILWLMTCLLAAPVAVIYDAPILAKALPVAGLSALFLGFVSIRLHTASRELRLGRVTAMRLGTQILSLLVIIPLAFWWQNIWALVVGGPISAFIYAIASHTALRGHADRLQFDTASARKLVSFGKYVFVATVAGYLVDHADRAILGTAVTLSELAFYNIALMFATIPLILCHRLVDSVIFPIYSRAPSAGSLENQRKTARLRWLLTAGAVSGLGFLALAGNELVRILYDARYADAGPILVLIAIAQLPGLVIISYASLALAAGESRRYAMLQTAAATIKVTVLLFLATHYGLVGVAVAPAISTVLFYPILVFGIRRYGSWDPWHDLVAAIAACGIAAVALWVDPAARDLLTVFPMLRP